MSVGRSIHYFQMGLDAEVVIVKHGELQRYSGGRLASICPVCRIGPLLMVRKTGSVLNAHDRCYQCRAEFVYSDIIEVRKVDGFTIPGGL
jgi:hypothetical protein